MILNHETLHAVATKGCGFCKDQLIILGVASQPKRGWAQKLIGTEISDADYARLLSLKGSKSKPKQEKRDLANPHTYFAPVRATKEPAPSVCVTMQVPIELVETVQGLIRLLESLKASSQC